MNKCGEKNLFYIYCEEEEEEEQELEPSQDIKLEKITPTICFHVLASVNIPQTLKTKGHIKKKKVLVLIDNDSIHNFVNYK